MSMPLFQRSPGNPIITRKGWPCRVLAVLNPGAVEDADGRTVLLVRVETVGGFSDIHVASSDDGIGGWRVDREPILAHGLPDCRYEDWGCEDPRVVRMEEDGCWYITYVANSALGPAVGIARTTDLHHAERLALIGSTNDKDGVLFPEKIGGRYAILHRPDAGGNQHIWSAYSDDLVMWGEPHCVLRQGVGPAWDGLKVGAGPPPIRTDEGWLLLYHGVKRYGGETLYRAGLALLDLERPHKILARTLGSVFEAEAPYETSGLLPNVVYPSGAILRDGRLRVYYGAADSCICVATARLDDLLGELEPALAE